MTPLDALRLAVASCPAARGHVPDGLSTEGISNRLKTHGIDPETLQPGTSQQIAQWRATLGTASGPYSTEQIKLDSAAYRAARDKHNVKSIATTGNDARSIGAGDQNPGRKVRRHAGPGRGAGTPNQRGLGIE